MPELLWKAYIDFEIEEGEREIARALYERLVALSGHVKVWISYALFEAEPIPVPRAVREEEEEDEGDEEDEKEARTVPGDAAVARQVFERGYKDLKTKGLKSEVSKRRFILRYFMILSVICSVLHCSRYGKHSRRAVARKAMWQRCRV